MEKKTTVNFIIDNQINELPALVEKIEELAAQWNLTPQVVMNVHLALEEALSNIIFYGYQDEAKHVIEISLTLHDSNLSVVITDDGVPFDPTSHKEPDLSLPVEERLIGGLGIFLMSKTMDSMDYIRKNGRNILTLHKNLNDQVKREIQVS
jgi:serine/threonine-protein kinase RsbW